MKVSISEIRKNKVFLFLAPDATQEELQDFDMKVHAWMSTHFDGIPCSFYLRTSDGGKAILSIVDINADHDSPHVDEMW